MSSSTINELKNELTHRQQGELTGLLIRMAKFSNENKNLLEYLLFDETNEEAFKSRIKAEVDALIETMDKERNFYYVKKSFRRILRHVNAKVKYSNVPGTKAELLLYFYLQVGRKFPPYDNSLALLFYYQAGYKRIKAAMAKVHEDIQIDFRSDLDALGQMMKPASSMHIL